VPPPPHNHPLKNDKTVAKDTSDVKKETKREHLTVYPSPRLPDSPSKEPTDIPTHQPTISPTKSSNHAKMYHLVMSDEFNVPHRTFQDGTDPLWTAMDKNDYTNGALHYYSPDNAVTDENGNLLIKTEAKETAFVGFNDKTGEKIINTKHFKSAMLQSWNKFCFTGGIVEAEIQLPGSPDVGGLWPAFWLLGNVARHTYVGSTNHIWPWSSNVCTEKAFHAQRINGCMKAEHYGLKPNVGRGSPEIDIFEVQAGSIKANTGPFFKSSVGQPFLSTSYQVAPGRPHDRPGGGYWPAPWQWYRGLYGGANSSLNILFYGDYNHFRGDPDTGIKDYWSDAISYNHQLSEKHFKTNVKYRVEWELPDEEDGTDGYIRWFIDDKFSFHINGTGIVEAGTGSTISTEPMYIIMNTAVSTEWGFPSKCPANCPCKNYNCNSEKFQETCGFSQGFCKMMTNISNTPTYKVNYVRVYQNPKDPKHKVGCSTPERPTKQYIESHQDLYKTENDDKPLKPIVTGKGKCSPFESNGTCGGSTRGYCSLSRTCECHSGWTGPHCLVPIGFDPINYEHDDNFSDLEFTGPYISASILWIGMLSFVVIILFAPTFKRRLDGWTPIEDNE